MADSGRPRRQLGVPGRPRARHSRATTQARTAILRAVEALLAEQRLGELTVGDVVKAAGVSRASFYLHFESKAAVVAALVDDVIDEIYTEWRPWFDGEEETTEATLARNMTHTARVWQDHAALLTATVEAWHTDPEIYDLWGGMLLRFKTGVAARIERDRAAGVLPGGGSTAHELAAALVWLNERVLYVAASGAEPAFDAGPLAVVPVLAGIWSRALGAHQ